MKRLLKMTSALLGLLIVITACKPSGSPLTGTSPLTQAQSSLATPTPRPTLTKIPPPPTQIPSPTFTPAPPTSTPQPLPTLVPGRQTFVYATTKDGRPELYRFQVDGTAHKAGAAYGIDTGAWPTSRTRIEGLYRSPDGKHVAAAWVYGEGGTFISILDVDDGILRPLFDTSASVDKRVSFLDWSPDGNSILALGRDANPDLRGSAWLVNIHTHQFHAVNIKQTTDAQQITGASFSPDGKTIVYARSECYKCGSEVWRVALDGSDQQLLFKVPQLRVEQVLWSPDGHYIAYTQWQESEAQDLFIGGVDSVAAVGELWVMDIQKDERLKISSVLAGYYRQFGLAWSTDGEQIAFVMSDEAKLGKQVAELHSNIYVADVKSNNVKQLTRFSRTQILAPTWAPAGSMLAFAGNPDGVPGQLELWVMKADGSTTQRVDESHGLTVNASATNVAIVWLP